MQAATRSHLKLRPFDADTADTLARFLQGEALRLDRTASLLGRARAWLRDERVLAPAAYVLRRAVGAARQEARTILTDRMVRCLSPPMRERLDALLDVGEEDPFSPLNRIKSAPSSPSTAGMRRLLARLELIEETDVLGIDVSWVNGNYQRVLFHTVRTGSIKIRGVQRRNRVPCESRTGARGRRMDVRASMSATLTPRILILPKDLLADARRRGTPAAARREMTQEGNLRVAGLAHVRFLLPWI